MSEKEIRPFGSWPSRITPDWIGDLQEFSELSWSGNGHLLWVERHSNHSSLMSWDPITGQVSSLSGEINVSGGLMYGGGSYHALQDQIVFIEKKTNHLFLMTDEDPKPRLILASPQAKASPRLSPFGRNLAYLESDGVLNCIKITNLSAAALSNDRYDHLALGIDRWDRLYLANYLRWHPFGTHLSWISWSLTHQPWDRSELNVAQSLYGQYRIPRLDLSHNFWNPGTSLLQPEFSPDGRFLSFISDMKGWWQIYLYNFSSCKIDRVTFGEADHALPPWLQNQTFYGFSPDSRRIYNIRYQQGFASLWMQDLAFNTETQITLPEWYTWQEWLAVNPFKDLIALVASGGGTPPEIIVVQPQGEFQVIRRAATDLPDQAYFSFPEPKTLKTPRKPAIYGLFYPPRNPYFKAEGKPPLLIVVHSGPTRQKYAEFQPRTQYFTSRGYAVLEVNYRGSTGYGRDYWEALQGQWGVLDVEDVYRSAKALARNGLIDPDRIALLGSSSGGLTVLLLLVRYPEFFQAAISLYGVTNLLELVKDPPQFERYYHDWLVGDPIQDAEAFKSRSPFFSADRIRTPVAIFQGGRDPIVPVRQAEQIVKALKANHVPHEYHLYPEEGHGFKNKENVADFYQKTEAFLRKYLKET